MTLMSPEAMYQTCLRRFFIGRSECDVICRINIGAVNEHFKVQMCRFQGFKQAGGAYTADYLSGCDHISHLHQF